MSKVALILEKMPEHCQECPCFGSLYFGAFCRDKRKGIEYDFEKAQYTKPDWCRLKELPKKQKLTFVEHGQDCITMGWNAAIEEIENDWL